jgi:hypothetical protein
MESRSSASRAPHTPHSFSSSTASTGTPSTPGLWSVSHERVRRGVEAWNSRRRSSASKIRDFGVDSSRALGSRRNVTPIPAGVPLGSVFSDGADTPGTSAGCVSRQATVASDTLRLELPQEAIDYLVTDVTFVWVQPTSTAPNTVLVTGSFLQWRDARQLKRDAEDSRLWTRTEPLPPGVHQYKFIVDGVWRHAPEQPVVQDERGILNNILTVNVELCGEGSCFCTRIYREINSRKSQGGGGADGSQANLPRTGANASLLSQLAISDANDWSSRSGGEESSAKQRIALKGRTGVALEYKEKRRTSPEPSAGQAVQPRSLATLAGITHETTTARMAPTITASESEAALTHRSNAHNQVSPMRSQERTLSDEMQTSQSHAADGAVTTSSEGKTSRDLHPGATMHLDDETPVPAKTFMHHDIDDAPFEATVVPDARELFSDSREMLPLESVLALDGQKRSADAMSKQSQEYMTTDGVSHGERTGHRSIGGASRTPGPAERPRQRPDSEADTEKPCLPMAPSDERQMRVMRLVSVAAAESELMSTDSWRKKSQRMPFVPDDAAAVDVARQSCHDSQPLEEVDPATSLTLKNVTAVAPTPWAQPVCPPRRNAVGRDGEDLIPEGAMSRVSSLNEIRQQHAQLTRIEDEAKHGDASNSVSLPHTQAGANTAAVKTPTRSAFAATNSRQGLLARPSSADSMVRLQRIPLELQYALRAEFSSPKFGFDPQNCHEDILLSTANQCARIRPQHSGLYRSVRGVLPVPPGSYFETIFAPVADSEADLSPSRSVVSTKLPARKRSSLFSGRVNSNQRDMAAACIGVALDTESMLLNVLLGGQAGGIGLHTSGFVVRWNAHTKRPEWHRATFHDGRVTSSIPAVVPPGAVIGVLRTHSKQGVRFFVNGLEIIPQETDSDDDVFSGGEWKCPAPDPAVETDTYKPMVSLFGSNARVYAAFSSDALHHATTATSSAVSSSSIDSSSSLCLQCLDGESIYLHTPPALA